MGLEIGFHVPSIPGGRVITRLGRNADLILREVPKDVRKSPMATVHVAFEIHPVTFLVLLSVRAKNRQSVTVAIPEKREGEAILGDCVILYGQNYRVDIASYQFNLVWRNNEGIATDTLKELTIQGYEESLQRLQDVRSRDQPSGFDESELHSWHMTRLHTAKGPLIQEVKELRVFIGKGAFSQVYKTVDRASGNTFAVKMVDLRAHANPELARAAVHREIKALEGLKHVHTYLLALTRLESNHTVGKHHRISRPRGLAHRFSIDLYALAPRESDLARQRFE